MVQLRLDRLFVSLQTSTLLLFRPVISALDAAPTAAKFQL